MRTRTRKSPLRHLVWIIPLLVLDFFIFRWLALRPGGCHLPVVPPPPVVQEASEPEPPPPAAARLAAVDAPHAAAESADTRCPRRAAADRLRAHPNPPSSGPPAPASATAALYPAFHEGVDIAATARDRKGIPTDPVFAVAEGRVAFVNSHGGNSTYGKYVVLEHPDPSLGMISRSATAPPSPATVYTLYAHLADIRFGIRPGRAVAPGDVLGTLGHTSSTRPPIPLARSHLHWEIGVLFNARFEIKGRADKIKPDFGNYNGGNLFGFDPLDFYAAHSRDPGLTMASYLSTLPPACEVLLRGKTPDYFRRFPALWTGAPHDGGPIRLTLSESGAPLSGRNATAAEIDLLGNQRQAVVQVFPEALGRNGRAYIAQSRGKWQFTEKGKQWADLLFY